MQDQPIPAFWMVTNRQRKGDDLTSDRSALSYWIASDGDLGSLKAWQRLTEAAFKARLIEAADGLPLIVDPARHEEQRHVTLFVHGYNNSWAEAVQRYRSICDRVFTGGDGLGLCVLFTWPSFGSPADYLPDRSHARESATDLASILSVLYDWLVKKQIEGASDPAKACRAKTSLIAHSMGNYVLQKAMQLVWTRKNQPLLVSLINQLLMVAADVDNDLFKSGEAVDKGDGDAIANLTYRVTALYSGRDPVLGLSAGLKHFGKRRLGRSGLDRTVACPDNVWDIDCSQYFPSDEQNIHSAYFETDETIDLMKLLLRGIDRKVVATAVGVPAAAG